MPRWWQRQPPSRLFHPGPFTRQRAHGRPRGVLARAALMEAGGGWWMDCRGRPSCTCPLGVRELRQRRARGTGWGFGVCSPPSIRPRRGDGELIARDRGALPGGADRRIQDTDPCSGASCAAFSCRTVTCLGDGWEIRSRRSTASRRRIWGHTQGRAATHREGGRVAPETFVSTALVREPQPADGARLVRSAWRAGGGGPAQRRRSADPCPQELPPATCPGWGEDRAASLERGCPSDREALFLNLLERGIEVRGGRTGRGLLPEDFFCLLVSRHTRRSAAPASRRGSRGW